MPSEGEVVEVVVPEQHRARVLAIQEVGDAAGEVIRLIRDRAPLLGPAGLGELCDIFEAEYRVRGQELLELPQGGPDAKRQRK